MFTKSLRDVSTSKPENQQERREPRQSPVPTWRTSSRGLKPEGSGAGGTSPHATARPLMDEDLMVLEQPHGVPSPLLCWLLCHRSAFHSSSSTASRPVRQHSRHVAFPRSLCKPPRLTKPLPPSWPGGAASVRAPRGHVWLGVTDALGYSYERSYGPRSKQAEMVPHYDAFVFRGVSPRVLQYALSAPRKGS